MIKFKTSRNWKGERVKPGDPVSGSQKEIEALLNCGQAYEELSVPNENSTKAEIKTYLDSAGIEYNSDSTKAELLECLPSD